ncbi:MAG: hypothetical protein QOI76_1585 [Frankiales bacterium]|nr:hypothetical protein [Frankiales bacterium]
MPHPPGRRRRLSRMLGCALAAASACLALGLASAGVARADGSSLTTDAAGSPLVNAAQLSPGHVLERCVVVTSPTDYTSADLGMFVTASGALADHLNVTIESGTGGSFADCAGFSGRLLFVGTLAALAAGFDGTRPERVGHFSASVGTAVLRLRFSVQDDNGAQGLTTAAAFWWLPVAAEPVAPPTTDPPAPSTTPTGTTSTEPAAVPTPPGPTNGPTSRGPKPSASPVTMTAGPTTPAAGVTTTPAPASTSLAPPVGVPLTDQGGSPTPGAAVPATGDGGSPPGIVSKLANGLANGVASAAQTISTAAAPVLKGAAVTSLMILPLVVLFLLVQRWIDRRDPKLALAPSYGDQFLGFVDRHRLSPPDRQGDPS